MTHNLKMTQNLNQKQKEKKNMSIIQIKKQGYLAKIKRRNHLWRRLQNQDEYPDTERSINKKNSNMSLKNAEIYFLSIKRPKTYIEVENAEGPSKGKNST